jgi:hypothetical protein
VFPKPATLRFRVSKLARFEQRFDINFDTLQDPRLQRSAVEDALRPAQAGVVFRRS